MLLFTCDLPWKNITLTPIVNSNGVLLFLNFNTVYNALFSHIFISRALLFLTYILSNVPNALVAVWFLNYVEYKSLSWYISTTFKYRACWFWYTCYPSQNRRASHGGCVVMIACRMCISVMHYKGFSYYNDFAWDIGIVGEVYTLPGKLKVQERFLCV